MRIITETLHVETKSHSGIVDITDNVQKIVTDSGLKEGNALVFAVGSTVGVTTIEYEPGLLKDYPDFMERIVPSSSKYQHDETWHDGNGFAHVRSSLQGTSFTVPFSNSKLLLGTWQQIILVNFDNRTRKRNIVVQLIGE
jgi:secondary thiamine-phosphate synthase enzyme